MSHVFHPDVHEHGLFDDCPGCDELAANPIARGDEQLLGRWLLAAVAVPRSFAGTTNELVAVKNVLDALERVGRLAEVSPVVVGNYLNRWGV